MRDFDDLDEFRGPNHTAVRIEDALHTAAEFGWFIVFWAGLFLLPGLAGTSTFLAVAELDLVSPWSMVLQLGAALAAVVVTVAALLSIAYLADTPQAGETDE